MQSHTGGPRAGLGEGFTGVPRELLPADRSAYPHSPITMLMLTEGPRRDSVADRTPKAAPGGAPVC